jgi:hypothetical protein
MASSRIGCMLYVQRHEQESDQNPTFSTPLSLLSRLLDVCSRVRSVDVVWRPSDVPWAWLPRRAWALAAAAAAAAAITAASGVSGRSWRDPWSPDDLVNVPLPCPVRVLSRLWLASRLPIASSCWSCCCCSGVKFKPLQSLWTIARTCNVQRIFTWKNSLSTLFEIKKGMHFEGKSCEP